MFGSDACPDRPELADEPVWACTICAETYAECHPGTEEPIGSLADGGLRYARERAHAEVERIVRQAAHPDLARDRITGFLASHLGIDRNACREVRAFDLDQCRGAFAALRAAKLSDIEHHARTYRGPVKAKREALV